MDKARRYDPAAFAFKLAHESVKDIVKTLLHDLEIAEGRIMDWQPIETAPKDRTPILLNNGSDYTRVTVGYWGSTWSYSENKSYEAWLGEAWSDYDGNPSDGFAEGYPTHWMPLPEPPSSLPTG